MPRFSAKSMTAYAALWRPYNDVDIYVEDTNLIGFYERLFQTMLGARTTVKAIIPLANKAAVLAEARRLATDTSRKRFFLIDGDFEWSTGRIPRARGLYMLRCYSIENFAWDLRSLHQAAQKCAPQMTTSQIEAALTEAELRSVIDQLFPLFIAYAVCFRLGASCETVSHAVVRLFETEASPKLCARKIRSRIRDIVRAARAEFGLDLIRRERRHVQLCLERRRVEPAHFISGKDYLLKFVNAIFHQRFGYRGNMRQLLSTILTGSTQLEKKLERSLRRAVR
ncbi:DUF4435 domain-containing protein [Bradyrhizobium sp. SZCCHNRI1003]|uniref:DUF4435 domain-containing protein n=2 Tax=unclassified Bradyrhizobium TaxID=2631580 RepID=UPI003966CC51